MPGMPGPPPGAPPGGTTGGVPNDAIEAYQSLRQDIIKMETAANEAEEQGDAGGASFKFMLIGEMNEKLKDLEKQHPGIQKAASEAKPPGPPPAPPSDAGAVIPAPGIAPVWGAGALPPPPLGMPPPPIMPMTITQVQAMQYEREKAASNQMEPDVVEFAAHFDLSDRHARSLNEAMKERNNTYDEDLAALYEILGKCNNSAQRADLLNMNVRWMKEGIFHGEFGPNAEVAKAAKKYKLDPPSACKLADALSGRKDPDDDMQRINLHLERSNKPSSLVMMMLKDLKAGNAIDAQNTKPAAIGSWHLARNVISRVGR